MQINLASQKRNTKACVFQMMKHFYSNWITTLCLKKYKLLHRWERFCTKIESIDRTESLLQTRLERIESELVQAHKRDSIFQAPYFDTVRDLLPIIWTISLTDPSTTSPNILLKSKIFNSIWEKPSLHTGIQRSWTCSIRSLNGCHILRGEIYFRKLYVYMVSTLNVNGVHTSFLVWFRVEEEGQWRSINDHLIIRYWRAIGGT